MTFSSSFSPLPFLTNPHVQTLLGHILSAYQTSSALRDLGLTKLPAWERAAVVSDTSWVRQMASAFLFFVAKDTRVFSNSEISDAKAWIMSGIEAPATESRIEPFRPPVPPTIELPTRPGQPSRRGTHLYKRP